MKLERITRPLHHVALIGNALPRQCGLATYTTHSAQAMRAAYPGLVVDHYAMDDDDGTTYDDSVCHLIPTDEAAAYVRAGARIEASGAQAIWVQHEFGIFGGPAGDKLLILLRHCTQPVVVTLHTVLADPDPNQRRVMAGLANRAAHFIVMADHAAQLLHQVYGIDRDRISLVPHGAPDRPLLSNAVIKQRLGLPEGPMLMSFGLLSPGKGYEVAIRALPRLVAAHPDLRYRIIGATHPHLRLRDGEQYREMLRALADDLGVGANVEFVNTFLDDAALLDQLGACDVYVTPYLGLDQVTSGTLAYALALGRPVVSTPYIHAREALADGIGTLVPVDDPDAIADAVLALLADPDALAGRSRAIWQAARPTIWSCNAERVMQILVKAWHDRPARLLTPRPVSTSAVNLAAVDAFTDDVGILQHSVFGLPNRHHGYCIDDNARALILLCRTAAGSAEQRGRLLRTYAAFMHHAWAPDQGGFRNFMGYDRQWLEPLGSEDSNGRAIWALGEAAGSGEEPGLVRWATDLLAQTMPIADAFGSPRAIAFAMLGMAAAWQGGEKRAEYRAYLARGARLFAELLGRARRPDWAWFEAVLSYDNARLPQALIEAGMVLKDAEMIGTGIDTLDWIMERQTAPQGHFRPIGSESFGERYATSKPFDQQPVDATATIDACATAWRATRDPRWVRHAQKAMAWFEGANDLGLGLFDARDGGCFDGLTAEGVNLNRGAESLLAVQQAIVTMATLGTAVDMPARRDENPLMLAAS